MRTLDHCTSEHGMSYNTVELEAWTALVVNVCAQGTRDRHLHSAGVSMITAAMLNDGGLLCFYFGLGLRSYWAFAPMMRRERETILYGIEKIDLQAKCLNSG
jgi:hypothetical protein